MFSEVKMSDISNEKNQEMAMIFNIVGAGFNEEVLPEVRNNKYFKEYINNEISISELKTKILKGLKDGEFIND